MTMSENMARLQELARCATRCGDVEEIRRCLALLCDPQATDRTAAQRQLVHSFPPDTYGQTLLHEACLFGRVAAVDMLLTGGADASALTMNRRTPLMYAADRGHTDVVALLLARAPGACHVDAKDAKGATALEYAAANGWIKVADMIAERSVLPYLPELRAGAQRAAATRAQYDRQQRSIHDQQRYHELSHKELEHAHYKPEAGGKLPP